MIAKLIKIICISSICLGIFAGWVYADTPELQFSALNAGYKDEYSSQNYDFIELRRNIETDLILTDYKLFYYNSAGNLAGELTFDEYILVEPTLVLSFSSSPQAQDQSDEYLYGFSSSGLASTAGRLQLLKKEQLIDEICWGKKTCDNFYSKFSTAADDNLSLHLGEEEFLQEKYYPASTPTALQKIIPDPIYPPCVDLIITEYQSYTDIPFIEIYNNSTETRDLSGCQLRYKNETTRLKGLLAPGAYYASYDIKLNKNPSSQPAIQLIDEQGNVVDEVIHAAKQRKDTSIALVADLAGMNWKRTYAPTPGVENIYQEFQSCPEGKVINPLTGNCIKEVVETEIVCPEGKYLNILTGRCKTIETKKTTVCKEGYYLNPLTGRCKKYVTTDEPTPCKEGYERNPETGRCRKVTGNTGDEYALAPIKETEYHSPQIFIATTAIVALVVIALICVCFQFRKEIKKRIIRLCRRKKS